MKKIKVAHTINPQNLNSTYFFYLFVVNFPLSTSWISKSKFYSNSILNHFLLSLFFSFFVARVKMVPHATMELYMQLSLILKLEPRRHNFVLHSWQKSKTKLFVQTKPKGKIHKKGEKNIGFYMLHHWLYVIVNLFTTKNIYLF